MKRFVALAVLSVLLAASAGAFAAELIPTLSAAMQRRIDAAWQGLDRGEGTTVWQQRTSLPFPRAWPRVTTSSFYLYAAGQDLRHLSADGERDAAPWARVDVAGERQELVPLAKALTPLEIQGVRPLTAKEVALDRAYREAAAHGAATYESQRDYYCAWLGMNGVIAAAIRPQHEAFIRWLGCK